MIAILKVQAGLSVSVLLWDAVFKTGSHPPPPCSFISSWNLFSWSFSNQDHVQTIWVFFEPSILYLLCLVKSWILLVLSSKPMMVEIFHQSCCIYGKETKHTERCAVIKWATSFPSSFFISQGCIFGHPLVTCCHWVFGSHCWWFMLLMGTKLY